MANCLTNISSDNPITTYFGSVVADASSLLLLLLLLIVVLLLLTHGTMAYLSRSCCKRLDTP